MKKLFGLALAGASALTLASCGEDYDLFIYQFKVEIQDDLEDLVDQFETDKGYSVKIVTVGGGEDYGAALTAEMSKNNKPSIFNIGGPDDVAIWEDYLVDVKGTTLYNKVSDESLMKDVTVDSKVYGYPMSVEGYGLIYDKTQLAKLIGQTISGIDTTSLNTIVASMRQSYANTKALIEFVNNNLSVWGGEAAFKTPASETWITGLHMAAAASSRAYPEGVSALSKAKTFEANDMDGRFTDLKDTYDLYINNDVNSNKKSDINSVTNTEALTAFATGKTMFVQTGDWAYGQIVDYGYSGIGENLGFLPLPYNNTSITNAAEKTEDYNAIMVGVPMYWSINSKVSINEQEIAKEFMEYMYITHLNDYVVDKFGFTAPYDGANGAANALTEQIQSETEEGTIISWTHMGFPAGWGMDTFGAEVQKYTAGTKSWADVITTSGTKWNEARA